MERNWVVKMLSTVPPGTVVFAFVSLSVAEGALDAFRWGSGESEYLSARVPEGGLVDTGWACVVDANDLNPQELQ